MAWDHTGRLSVVVHSELPPSSLEWSRYLNANRILTDLRVMVCTYGGGPDGGQRRELMDDVFYNNVPTVVMTNSVVVRCMVNAINWFNRNMKALPIDADVAAHRLLGLSAQEAVRALELREKLERELGVGRFAGHATGVPVQPGTPGPHP